METNPNYTVDEQLGWANINYSYTPGNTYKDITFRLTLKIKDRTIAGTLYDFNPPI